MDERLRVVIDNAISAIVELERKMRITSIYPNLLGDTLQLFIRDAKDLERLPGPTTVEPWIGPSADYRLTKQYNGITLIAAANKDEVKGVVFNGQC